MIRVDSSTVEDPGDRSRPTPRSRLLLSGALIVALWALTLLGLGPIFEPGPWLWRAMAIVGATLGVACLLRVAFPGLRVSASLGGAVAGTVCWAMFAARSEHAEGWLRDPLAMLDAARVFIVSEISPAAPNGPFEDLLLLAVLLLVTLTTLLLVGAAAPFGAGAVIPLLLLVPAAVTGQNAGWQLLLGVGALLALLAWIGSPLPNPVGLIAAGLAVAVAAGAVAAAPPMRERVWNESLMLGPVSSTAPDVTIALAEDLRNRSNTRAFRYKGEPSLPYRFTLATLAEFEGGRWLPESELDAAGRTVDEPRIWNAQSPGNTDLSGLGPSHPVTLTIEGLVSNWLPLPHQSTLVTEVGDPGGFDATQWRWLAASDTARSDAAVTRTNDRYLANSRQLFATEMLMSMSGSLTDEGANRLYPGAAEPPEALAPYLELPGDLPAVIAESAQAAAGTAQNRIEVGVGLHRWFSGGGFIYDESAPYAPGADPDDPYAVMAGLLTERRGFCVHYASTFAVMARSLGVPARLAVGYASRSDADGGETAVRGSDLHAWPELYIDGLGWVPFEPTPGGAGVRADQDIVVPPVPEAPPETDVPPEEEAEPELPAEPQPEEVDASASDVATAEADGIGARWALASLAVLLIAALLGSPAIVRRLREDRRRRRIMRGANPAQHAWAEFIDTARDLGLLGIGAGSSRAVGARGAGAHSAGHDRAPVAQSPRALTPEAIVEHLSGRGLLPGDSEHAAWQLAESVAAERYWAGHPLVPGEQLILQLDLARRGLRSGASRPARLRATFMPRSLLLRPPVILRHG